MTSPSRKTVAPMCEKMGFGLELSPDELPVPTMVAASEGPLLGAEDETRPRGVDGGAAVPGKVTSAASTPGRVIPSESRAGLGVGAELSPLDTAIPSCARRAAPSLSPAIYPFLRAALVSECVGGPPTRSLFREYTSILWFLSLCFERR